MSISTTCITATAIRDVIASGKATYWGFSNHYGWKVAEIIRLCDQTGTPYPVVSQPMYNIVMRQPENDHLPACEHFGIGVAPFSPLARGALTGKYEQGKTPPANSRAGRGDASIINRDLRPEVYKVVDAIKKHVAKRGMTPAEFATLWVLNNKIVTSVITGPRTLQQWKGYIDALKHEFTAEDEAGGQPRRHRSPGGAGLQLEPPPPDGTETPHRLKQPRRERSAHKENPAGFNPAGFSHFQISRITLPISFAGCDTYPCLPWQRHSLPRQPWRYCPGCC